MQQLKIVEVKGGQVCVRAKSFSRVLFFVTLWTVACLPSLSMGFSMQEYWNGLPFPSPGDLPNPGIEPGIPHCSWILYHLSHQGSPRILERVPCPFHRGTSLPRNWASVSCIAGRFFTSWATREVCGCSISEVSQSCPTRGDPMDCSPPGSSVHGILQARILVWVAISFSRGSCRLRDRTQVSFIAGRRFNLWATREAAPWSPTILCPVGGSIQFCLKLL